MDGSSYICIMLSVALGMVVVGISDDEMVLRQVLLVVR